MLYIIDKTLLLIVGMSFGWKLKRLREDWFIALQ